MLRVPILAHRIPVFLFDTCCQIQIQLTLTFSRADFIRIYKILAVGLSMCQQGVATCRKNRSFVFQMKQIIK